ncbi:MAG: hypothetical protein DLM70_19750 [Chloroflexi bacterium]|nr:MAG: hypothetical protein DLM70_19750 [Chloroflexota bacterium]
MLLFCSGSVVHAANPASTQGESLRGLLAAQTLTSLGRMSEHTSVIQTMRAFRELAVFRAFPRAHPEGNTRSRTNTSGSDLALPDSDVSGYGSQGSVAAGQGPFSGYHQSYGGFQSGVAADLNFEPILTLYYQGTVFSDSASASAYMVQGLAGTGSTTTPTDCSGTVGVPCQIEAFNTSGGKLDLYNVAQINYCVIETGYQGDPTLINQHSADVTKVLADTFLVGITEAKQACASSSPNPVPQPQPQTTVTAAPSPTPIPTAVSQPSISISGLALVHTVKKKVKATTTLKLKEAGLFVATYQAENAGTLTPSATVTILKGSKEIANGDMKSDKFSDGTTYFYAAFKFKLKTSVGHLTARVTVTLGSAMDARSLNFKLKKK